MRLKSVLASCLVVALGLILVYHFVLFWVYGGAFIYEDNSILLSIETVVSLAIIGFGVERFINSTTRRSGE